MKLPLAIVLLILPAAVVGSDDVEIPVITNLYTFSGLSPAISKDATKSIVNKVGAEKIATTIRDVKTTVCGAVESGDIKVYFTFDADGKVFGIGASAGAGIEVTFNCERGKSP